MTDVIEGTQQVVVGWRKLWGLITGFVPQISSLVSLTKESFQEAVGVVAFPYTWVEAAKRELLPFPVYV